MYIVNVFVPQYFRFVTVSDFRASGIITKAAFKKRVQLHQMSNEKKNSCLGYIGHFTTQ